MLVYARPLSSYPRRKPAVAVACRDACRADCTRRTLRESAAGVGSVGSSTYTEQHLPWPISRRTNCARRSPVSRDIARFRRFRVRTLRRYARAFTRARVARGRAIGSWDENGRSPLGTLRRRTLGARRGHVCARVAALPAAGHYHPIPVRGISRRFSRTIVISVPGQRARAGPPRAVQFLRDLPGSHFGARTKRRIFRRSL